MTHLRCGGIFSNPVIANCIQSAPVKEYIYLMSWFRNCAICTVEMQLLHVLWCDNQLPVQSLLKEVPLSMCIRKWLFSGLPSLHLLLILYICVSYWSHRNRFGKKWFPTVVQLYFWFLYSTVFISQLCRIMMTKVIMIHCWCCCCCCWFSFVCSQLCRLFQHKPRLWKVNFRICWNSTFYMPNVLPVS